MKTTQSKRGWGMLVIFIGAALISGAIGSWATFPSVRAWYPTLNKPTWNPPNWIFGPMWTTLYVLMGIAVWRAWRRCLEPGVTGVRTLLKVYFVHLIFNALWSVLFFGLKQPTWALVDIVVLWLMLVWLQCALWKTDRVAGVLWLPYLLWVSFATALNAAIVRLN
ncbi:TspO/MBR family protein [Oleiharenicola lentus]|uniref:TspO/MBR family protein n=1 Tax=Oleiharenicola lentus TaxID=2508720 RepID=UPI003F66AD21